jgi:cytochrome c-type biogenesis protein CcmH/NrfF
MKDVAITVASARRQRVTDPFPDRPWPAFDPRDERSVRPMKTHVKSLGALLALVAGLALSHEPLLARTGQGGALTESLQEADEAISRLRSPFCPGLMLEVCPSPQAAVLRDSIQALAAQGWTRKELVDWVVATYGEEYRAVPEPQGRGLVAWAIPPAALLLGLAVVLVALGRLRAGGRVSSPLGAVAPEEEERLARALRELEESEEAL